MTPQRKGPMWKCLRSKVMEEVVPFMKSKGIQSFGAATRCCIQEWKAANLGPTTKVDERNVE